jgi:hypothetical protein
MSFVRSFVVIRLRAGRTSFAHTQITNSHVGNKLFFSPKLSRSKTQWPRMIYITHNGDTSRKIKYTPSLLTVGRESHDFLVRFQLFYTQRPSIHDYSLHTSYKREQKNVDCIPIVLIISRLSRLWLGEAAPLTVGGGGESLGRPRLPCLRRATLDEAIFFFLFFFNK